MWDEVADGAPLAVGGDFGRQVLDASSAAALTQDVSIQRVAALTLAFGRQQEAALLTNVAVNVEAAVKSYDPDGFLLARFGHDGLATHGAARGVLPVEVVDAVYVRHGVHSERHAVQAAVADHTREAARVVGFPHGPQNPVQDGL